MKKVILEDSSMYNVNRQQSGITASKDSKGEVPPNANKTSTFLDANKRDKNYDAPNVKPYPLGMADEMVSDMYISASNLRKILRNAVNNPALKKDKHKNIIYINKQIEFISKAIVDISLELDKI
jgi:hypothetical protein